MNFVAHLFLSPSNDAFRVGSILADFTVGTIDNLSRTFGPDIAVGIRHHREVDRFTDTHDAVIQCVKTLQHPFGIYGSIVSDVVFDHFLLKHWSAYSPIKKELFFASVYQSLSLPHPDYPTRFHAVIQRMLERKWLHTYEQLENVAYALMRVGERFSRPTPLQDALLGLQQHYRMMEQTFIRFFPDLQQFADEKTAELLARR